MSSIQSQAEAHFSRRGLLAAAVAMSAATGLASGVRAQQVVANLGALKRINAGDLSIAYVETGPVNGPVMILLHGWPYDIHSFAEVMPILASAGYRVIAPHLRGYGETRFLSDDTMRNGQPAALASDVIALMDALRIKMRSWAASIGARARQTSSRRCGPSG